VLFKKSSLQAYKAYSLWLNGYNVSVQRQRLLVLVPARSFVNFFPNFSNYRTYILCKSFLLQ